MKLLARIEKFVAKFAVQDLMKYIMMASFTVYIMDMAMGNMLSALLSFNRQLILQGQFWRIFTFVFVPNTGSLFVIISMLFYFFIGRVLEMSWGVARFNTYYFMGVLFTIIGGFFLGFATTYYLNLTLFLAYATTFPDNYVNLYFLLPVKVKYLGYVYGFMVLMDFLGSGWILRIILLISLLNYFIFFGGTFFKRSRRRAKTQTIRRNIETAKMQTRTRSVHKCTVCGMTEQDDPDMEFRFCSQCEGNYEYCARHIRDHEHKTKVISMEHRRKSES